MEYTWMVELDWGALAELNSTNKLGWDTVISLLVDPEFASWLTD